MLDEVKTDNSYPSLKTTPVGTTYDRGAKILHWSMAGLLLVQFVTAAPRALSAGNWSNDALMSTHKVVGTLLMALVVVRIIWAIVFRGRRPPRVSMLSALGHFAMYALMFIVPLVGLLRQYGSGRTFEVFGFTLMPGFEGKIEWMVVLGNEVHGLVGWILFALIFGHISMALGHARAGDKSILARMLR